MTLFPAGRGTEAWGNSGEPGPMSSAESEIQVLFDAAIAIDSPLDRARYLDRALANNPLARARVEELLRAHEEAGGFLGGKSAAIDATSPDFRSEGPGTILGPYKLLQEIGQGGMGVVYMAEQHAPVRRMVALKMLKPGIDTRQVVARFEAERQALSMMDHPNIARVLDAGASASGRPYFVMELVKGRPITEYCDDRHLSPRQRLELLLPVLQAVQHAHQKGIIHRDLKPSNVLVAEYDQHPVPKVIDFGVAKATCQPLTEKTLFTAFGQVVGTLEYMSPEQAKFNQQDIDTRSDIYSLGVLMYELLTGSTPFDRRRFRSGALDEVLRIIREEEPPRPSTRLSDSKDSLPSIGALRDTEPAKLARLMRGELDWIVMKALEKDRNRRYETANGMALDIQRYLDDAPVEACPPSARYRATKFIGRHRRAVAAGTALLLMLLFGIAGTTLGLFRAERATRDAIAARVEEQRQREIAENLVISEREAQQNATREKGRAEAAAADAGLKAKSLEKQLYVNLVGRAHSDWLIGNPLGARQRLDECPAQLRRWEWDFVQRLCHLDRWTIAGNGKCVWSVAMSADGRLLAYGSGRYLWANAAGEGRLDVVDSSDGRAVFMQEGLKGNVQGVAFSPDGRYLAGCTAYRGSNPYEGEVIVWDLMTQERRWSRKVPDAECLCVTYSGDGRSLAVGCGGYNSGDGRPWMALILDAENGETRLTLPSAAGSVHAVAFSPDGGRLALGEPEQVELFELEQGQLARRFGGHTSYVYAVAFSPDGQYMATGEYAPPTRVWHVESGHLVTQIQGDQARGLAFDREGRRLALATGVGRTVRICDPLSGETQATLRGHLAETMCVAFHPDGDRLASGSLGGEVKMWKAQSQPLVLRHPPRKAEHPWITSVAADRRGQRMVTVSRDNSVQLWDGEGDKPIRTWTGPQDDQSVWSDTFWSVVITPNARQAFAGHGRGTILRLNLENGEALTPIVAGEGPVMALAISPDGKWLASAALDGVIRVWSLPSGSLVHALPSHLVGNFVTCMEFSPDGGQLLAGSGAFTFLDSASGLALWDVKSGDSIWSLDAASVSARDVTFAPSGEIFVVAFHDGHFEVRDVRSGGIRESVRAHSSNAFAAEFTPDGTRLFTGGNEGIKVWDAVDWSEVFAYREQSVLCMALGDSAKKLVFGGYYPMAIVLDARPMAP